MAKKSSIAVFLFFITLLFFSGCYIEEDAYVPEYESPEPDMVLVTGGTYAMGDWNGVYTLDKVVSQNQNIKDVTPDKKYGLDFNFDARVRHNVTVSNFYISKYEVTYNQFDRFCYEMKGTLNNDGFDGDAETPPASWGRGKRPAAFVSWLNAIKFCNWLSVKEGRTPCYTINGIMVVCNWNADGYRLLTEAEWEYAARGGGGYNIYSGCNDSIAQDKFLTADEATGLYPTLRLFAWFNLTSGWKNEDYPGSDNGRAMPVGSKQPNSLGLYDMAGNVWEWVWDFYSPNYYAYCFDSTAEIAGTGNPGGPTVINPVGPDQYTELHFPAATRTTRVEVYKTHVMRGGSWGNYPIFLRTTFRFFSQNAVFNLMANPSYDYSNWRTGMRIGRKQ